MEYNRIVAVTGMPGLFEVVSSKADGAIVRSLEDKSTKFISSRVHNLSHLESIEVYTTGENVQLTNIFQAMDEKGTALPDAKDNNALRSYFEEVFPELDFERVYTSDMKKMVKWYEIIKNNDIDFTSTEEESEEDEEENEEELVEEGEEKAPAKKTAAKKAATKTAAKKAAPAKKASTEEKSEKAPAKKTAAAKKEKEAAPAKKAAAKKKKS